MESQLTVWKGDCYYDERGAIIHCLIREFRLRSSLLLGEVGKQFLISFRGRTLQIATLVCISVWEWEWLPKLPLSLWMTNKAGSEW